MRKLDRERGAIIEEAGLTLLAIEQRRKHTAYICTNGILFGACTPSDRRDRANFRAIARRLGREIE